VEAVLASDSAPPDTGDEAGVAAVAGNPPPRVAGQASDAGLRGVSESQSSSLSWGSVPSRDVSSASVGFVSVAAVPPAAGSAAALGLDPAPPEAGDEAAFPPVPFIALRLAAIRF
jgi:hypothetical protein